MNAGLNFPGFRWWLWAVNYWQVVELFQVIKYDLKQGFYLLGTSPAVLESCCCPYSVVRSLLSLHPDVYPQGLSKHGFHCMVLIALTWAPSGVPALCFHLHVYPLLLPPTAFSFFLYSAVLIQQFWEKTCLFWSYQREKWKPEKEGLGSPLQRNVG